MPYPELIWPMLTAFGLLLIAGIGLPPPEELPTVGAGIWVASNPELGPARWLILPVCFVGVLLSDVMLYSIGRFWGPRLLEYRWVKRIVPPEKREKIERNFHERGVKLLLLVRWMPGIRSPMFVTAGIMRLPVIRFVIADGIAAAIGHSLLFFLAWWFGESLRQLVLRFEAGVEHYFRPLLILLLISAVAGYLVWHFLRHPVSTGDPDEVPPVLSKVATLLEHKDHPAPNDPASAEKPQGLDRHRSGSLRRGEPAPDHHADGAPPARPENEAGPVRHDNPGAEGR